MNLVRKTNILPVVAFIVGFALTIAVTSGLRQNIVYAQDVPVGCPGGAAGPPSAGTVCPDGSVPVMDNSLPIGCPGSSQQGPVASNYTTSCPARPGRAQCMFSKSTGQCLNSAGIDVTNGDPGGAGGSGSSGNHEGKCEGGQINKDNCGIIAYLVDFINILSAIVGIVIVIMIAYGGIQYSASKDNPQESASAKQKISNAVLALVFYMFAYAFLQYIVPGGVL